MDYSGSAGVPLSSIFIIFFFIFIFTINPSSSVQVCKPARCSNLGWEPQIRFPFRLIGKQDQRCGYPGFDLSCNYRNQTILTLPHSGDFVVHRIDYSAQSIVINDPASCLPDRISNFSVNGSAFRATLSYKFFNCSLDWSAYNDTQAVPVFCSDASYNSTILALPRGTSSREIPSSSCTLMPNVSIPLVLTFTQYLYETLVQEDLWLTWNQPDCQNCELMGLYCGFKSDTGLDVGCSKPPGRKGLSRGAKYGIIIGVGVPGLVCLIGLLCYIVGKFSRRGRRLHGVDTDPSSSNAAMNPPPTSVTISGLDAPTIESYPKTVIGESRRLPEQCDGTCPICLSDYQPKETLKRIPACNHYFHAGCLDEWLKLNGSCPLCRNSPPETNSMTPCSSMSSTFSTSSSA